MGWLYVVACSVAVAMQPETEDNLHDLRIYAGAAVDKTAGGTDSKKQNITQAHFRSRWDVLVGATQTALIETLHVSRNSTRFLKVYQQARSRFKKFMDVAAGDSGLIGSDGCAACI